ncbi:MAG: prepilin peptidase [Myxococcota bacterium]
MWGIMYSNQTLSLLIKISAFIIGTFLGSFLNVCIYRIPYRKSILYPGSRCFLCLTPLRWYHNLPVLGYFLLGGRCAFCHQKFSIRYAVVEFLMGWISLSLFTTTTDFFSYIVYLIFMGAIIVLSFIDIDHWLLPDRITIPVGILGILLSLFNPVMPNGNFMDVKSSFIGAFVGFSIMYLLGFFASKILGKEALGGGDIKFMAMIGAFLGWRSFIPVLLMAALQGSIFGSLQILYFKIQKKEVVLNNNGIYSVFKDKSDLFTPTSHHIPFGPFLGLAAYEYLIWGTRLINTIFRLNF